MITFYPGPSKVYDALGGFMQEAFQCGILEQNHRSAPFMALLEETIGLLKAKLAVPPDYHVCFVSSATEVWEIIAQSLVLQSSAHFYNGSFGKKWAEYAANIHAVDTFPFGLNDGLSFKKNKADLVCLTHNETSNGTQIADAQLESFDNKLDPSIIVAVDATSSMAGVTMPWQCADVWFASVQKCFGLPAGMGVIVYSPKAMQRATLKNDRRFYNSLLIIHENFSQFQTHYTPNVLGIFLLNRVLKIREDIDVIAEKIKIRAGDLYKYFNENADYQILVENETVRSATVLAICGNENSIKNIKQKALEKGIVLGNGYGDFKKNTFRIANFPAIENQDFEYLKQFMTTIR